MDDYRLHTPEQVDIAYTVAGLGSRFSALLIDMVIQAVTLLPLAAPLWDWSYEVSDAYLALFILASVIILYGYFFIFELLLKGRTPGKVLMKIRVVRTDGRAADVSCILLRNLLRLIDFLPAFYPTGAITMFIHKDSRRLGDIVAGTIVIVERKKESLTSILAERDAVVNTALSNKEFAVIRDFFARRDKLTAEARSRLASAIAAPLYGSCDATEEEKQDPERFLERVLHANDAQGVDSEV
ncbi:MAG: RDD family protein [Clostridiales bacterium]|nr:RDD family protein [Clostridiales bacterium]